MDQPLPPVGLVHMTVVTGSCVLGKSSMLRAMTERWHEYAANVQPKAVEHVLPYIMYEMIGRSADDMYRITDDSVDEHRHLYRNDSCRMFERMSRAMRPVVHEYFHSVTSLTKRFARMAAENEFAAEAESGNTFETYYSKAVKGWVERLLDQAGRTMLEGINGGEAGDDASSRYVPIILDRWPQLDSEAFRMAAIAVQDPAMYEEMKKKSRVLETRAKVIGDCVTHLLDFVTQRRCLLPVDTIHCRPSPALCEHRDPSHITFDQAQQEQPQLDSAWQHAYVKPKPSRWAMYKAREAQSNLTEPPSVFCITKEEFEKFISVLDVELAEIYDEFLRSLIARSQRQFVEMHDAYFVNTAGEQRNPWTLDKLMRLRDLWPFARRGQFDTMLEGDVCSVAMRFTRFYLENHQRLVRRWVPYMLEWRGARVTWPVRGMIPFTPAKPKPPTPTPPVTPPPPSPSIKNEEPVKTEQIEPDDAVPDTTEAAAESGAECEVTSTTVKRSSTSQPLSAAEVLAYCGGESSQVFYDSDETVNADDVFEKWAKKRKIVGYTPQSPPPEASEGEEEASDKML